MKNILSLLPVACVLLLSNLAWSQDYTIDCQALGTPNNKVMAPGVFKPMDSINSENLKSSTDLLGFQIEAKTSGNEIGGYFLDLSIKNGDVVSNGSQKLPAATGSEQYLPSVGLTIGTKHVQVSCVLR